VPRRPFLRHVVVFIGFLCLAAAITYPQIVGAGNALPFHSDPYFSMWRLGWVAHQLPRDPRALFEANIFYPEHDTLAYSDAMLLPATVLAPLFWVGVDPVAIYNGALFAALTLSGFTAFLLATRLSGSEVGGLVAGVIFAFAPYHIDHYLHFELQMVFWIPLALSAVHHLIAEARIRDGVLLGAAVAAQTLSCMYAAVFFVTYCALFIPLLASVGTARASLRLVAPLIIAAALALAIAAPYSLAYARAERTVGTRSLDDVAHYSASFVNYIAAPPSNRLYGSLSARFGSDELYLFPGIVAVLLAALGVLRGHGRARLAYAGGLVLAFEMSRGVNGLTYPLLFQHVPPFQAFRSAARIGILVNLSIAVLSAYGTAWLLPRIRSHGWRLTAAAVIVTALVAEYASAPAAALAPRPAAVDRWLARQPPVVVVQLPMTRDWLYMYQGIAHAQKMLNGYSGFPPASYYATRDAMRSFPDDSSIAYLQARNVDYVIVRGEQYPAEDRAALVAKIENRRDVSLVARFPQDGSEDSVFAVLKPGRR